MGTKNKIEMDSEEKTGFKVDLVDAQYRPIRLFSWNCDSILVDAETESEIEQKWMTIRRLGEWS
jgi:hypothetical protein